MSFEVSTSSRSYYVGTRNMSFRRIKLRAATLWLNNFYVIFHISLSLF